RRPGTERVAEATVRRRREEGVLAGPAPGVVRRAERVEVHVPAVRIGRSADGSRAEAEHRLAAVQILADDLPVLVAPGPVLEDVDLRHRALPVRDPQLDDRLVRAPRVKAEVREHPLPGLQSPARAV